MTASTLRAEPKVACRNASLLEVRLLTLLFSCSSRCPPHRSTRPIAVQPLFFPTRYKSLNQTVLACYPPSCIMNLILAEVPPGRPSVLLPFPLTPSPELQLLYNPQFRKTGL